MTYELEKRKHRKSPDPHTRYVFRQQRAPDELIAERDECMARSRSLTEILMGDPLPGRSALSRAGG